METVFVRFAQWLVVFALMLVYWPFGKVAHAATQKGSSVAGVPEGEDRAFQKAVYTAQFDWKGSSYRFEVGTKGAANKKSGKSRFVAKITQKNSVVATCERLVKGPLPHTTYSMLMRCQGPMFGSATGFVRFEFSSDNSTPLLTVWPKATDSGLRVSLKTEQRTRGG